jgi:hypothetical protein
MSGSECTDALSMRGTQREVSAGYVARGYTPVGRWVTEAEDKEGALECVRTFRLRVNIQPIYAW